MVILSLSGPGTSLRQRLGRTPVAHNASNALTIFLQVRAYHFPKHRLTALLERVLAGAIAGLRNLNRFLQQGL